MVATPVSIPRRAFLKSAAACAALLPAALGRERAAGAQGGGERALVLLELCGGNDGLNTVVPYADDAYYRARGALAVPSREVLALDDRTGLHPELAGVKRLFDEGMVAIIEGVGYPGAERSHILSAEVWHGARPAGARATTGWIGRFLDGLEDEGGAPRAVAMQGTRVPLALAGEKRRAAALGLPPDTRPEDCLARAAAHLAGAPGLRAVHVSMAGFDTHSCQARRHAFLLRELDQALCAFFATLKERGLLERVLLFVYSEFGRRLPVNASGGTEHGAANPVLVLGARVAGGLHGARPRLADAAEDGALAVTTDFRSVYATLLERWFRVPAAPILGNAFAPLGFLA
ncbi:MAG: DUF1501 domain-containing protein [Planctomycetes bacterium]|nr:DUF1501 domain-containing protein [Planctomycetota bacterium]